MITKKYAYVRAVKNRLCRIESELDLVFIGKEIPEKEKRIIMKARIEIDSCVESLEKLLKIIN